MNEILQVNVLLLYFVYGLSFYTMGVAIALRYRSYSSFRLAYSLSLLAAFALLHGFSEWGSVFIPVRVPNFGDFPLWKLLAIQRLLQAVSYFFLFCFGVKLLSDSRRQNFTRWIILPALVFLAWLVEFSRFVLLVGSNELYSWLLYSEYWSRYILALPAGMLTAYGLYLQIPDVAKLNDKSVLRNLWIATVSFILFALFSGLVVPNDFGTLSHYINSATFHSFTGLPVELFRTLTALLATWSITSMLNIFDLEKQRQVTESRRLEAVYRERERFARDLHDDVIQSIYGVGLEMQIVIPLMEKDQMRAAGQVKSSIEHLNKVIHTLRAYIHGLETHNGEQDLEDMLEDMIIQFQQKTDLKIKLNFKLHTPDRVQPSARAEDWPKQLQQIIREALNNVVRHARASKAEVEIGVEGGCLVVTVKDNGRGLPAGELVPATDRGGHLGLRNMRTRAALLGGDLELFSQPGEGTRLVLSIPLFHEENCLRKAEKNLSGKGEVIL